MVGGIGIFPLSRHGLRRDLLMSKITEEKTKQEHQHWWVMGNNYSSEKCNCGMLKVFPMEYEMRIKAWESYFELVKTTPSYLDHQEMKLAWREKNLPKIAELREKIKQRTHKVINEFGDESIELDDPLPKPTFPDPSTWNKYVIA